MGKLPRAAILALLIALLSGISEAIPRSPVSTPPSSSLATVVSPALPGLTATPWSDQILSSLQVQLLPRQASSTAKASSSSVVAPATTAAPSLAQLVLSSTILSSLPPGICGFVPVWNVSTTSLKIIGCFGGAQYLSDTDTYPYDGSQICITTGSELSCVTSSCLTCSNWPVVTGCIDIATSALVSSYTTETYYDYYDSITVLSYVDVIETLSYVNVYSYSTSIFPTTWILNSSTSVRTATSIQTQASQSMQNTSIASMLSCYPNEFAIYGRCQTLALGQSAHGYRCLATTPSTIPNDPTLTILGLNDLRSTFPGLTVEFHTSQSQGSTYFWQENYYSSLTFPVAATQTPTPWDYLDTIAPAAPNCVNGQNTSCPLLFSSAKTCWSEAFPPGPRACYCSALEITNCTSLCQDTPTDRNSYFEWAMALCNNRNISTGDSNATETNFTSRWPDYANRSAGVNDDLLLRQWRLQFGNAMIVQSNTSANLTHRADFVSNNNTTVSAAVNSTCPSNTLKLVSFAIVNGVTMVFVLVARRGWINQLTMAYFGMPGSRTWPGTALLAVCLNLVGTAINAKVALSASGYGNEQNSRAPSMSTLFLFWTARPRTSWIATLFVSFQADKIPYLAVAVSSLMAEILQQIIGAAVFIETFAIAAHRGYFGSAMPTYAPSGVQAIIMYSGGLAWMVGFAGLLAFLAWNRDIWLGLFRPPANDSNNGGLRDAEGVARRLRTEENGTTARDPLPQPALKDEDFLAPATTDFGPFDERRYQAPTVLNSLMDYDEAVIRMGLNNNVIERVRWFFLWMLLPFAAQWLFWIGWVELAQDRYCPPRIASMTACWTVFEVLGLLLGAL